VQPGVGWCALRVAKVVSGKGEGKVSATTGAAGSLCALLAEASVKARLLSAFGMEVLLVPETSLPAAAAALLSRGHGIWPSTRVCNSGPWEAPKASSEDALCQKLAGVWSLVQREDPIGTLVEEYFEGDGPLRIQAPSSGLFVELRLAPEGAKRKSE
ncbi:unnamed protein product, partial [Polarella glacialis]